MDNAIRLALENFTLTLLVVGLMASGVSLFGKPHPVQARQVIEALFAYFILFSIAISHLYNFVLHVFFGEMTAQVIGWANSPFQAEVGFASLGFAMVGFLAFRGSSAMRTAAVVGSACFLLGAASGHILNIIKTRNMAAGNAGIVLYTDILLPVIGLSLLWLQRRYSPK